ncbi:MAG TPA: formate/nitrite transporter family protein [Xanthobacteraceae bacterium]|jgi:formate transporter
MNDERAPDPATPQAVTIDTIVPSEMARRAEQTGVRRASMDVLSIFVLSLLAGAFISFGAIFATTVTAGSISIGPAGDGAAMTAALPYGITRLLTGLVFSVGLIMVVVGGAELFTGNTLLIMAWASRKVTTRAVLLNWVVAFTGNCIGTVGTAALLFLSTQYTFGNGAVGLVALNTANSKAALAFVPALTLGILCNALVCVAVWMCFSARTTIDRVVTVVPPIAAFAAAGFEHSIANAYFLPIGLFIKSGAPDSFWASIGKTAADFPALTWSNFLIGNMLPVTIGNIIGGSLMVGAVYWFVYLRTARTP